MKKRVIRGIVRHGDRRGRALGYPTANLRLHQSVRDGVYFAVTRIGSKEYPSLAFVGAPKTFDSVYRRLEVHILDFSKNIYDQWIGVTLLGYVRGNERFNSLPELQKAMKSDEIHARKFFAI